jgi:hypothetical protein
MYNSKIEIMNSYEGMATERLGGFWQKWLTPG